MKNHIIFAMFFMTGVILTAQDNISFTKNTPLRDVLNTNGESKIVQNKDGVSLVLSGSSSFTFKKEFSVTPGQKYKLDITAKVNGADVIEKNSRIPEIQVMSHGLLSGWKMDFFDAEGNPIGSRNYNGMTFISEKKQLYNDVFYTPKNTVKMRLTINMGSNPPESLEIFSPLKLAPAPDEGAINCNPEFKYGYSGWNSFLRGALLIKLPDGKYAFDSAYGSGGEVFPIHKAGTYRIYGKAVTRGGYRVINFEQRDKNNKVIKVISLTANPNGHSIDFILQPETTQGRFNVYNHTLEEVRLMHMGDDSMLEKLDAERKAALQKK